jgi:hypothetical protein
VTVTSQTSQSPGWAVPTDGLQSGVLYARGEDPSAAHTPGTSTPSIYEASQGPGKQGPGTTYRSGDGGKSWRAVADAPGPLVLPAGGAPACSLDMDTVYRSVDMGTTWSPVLQLTVNQVVHEPYHVKVLFSPTFQQDGTAFAFSLGSDQLYRTNAGGTPVVVAYQQPYYLGVDPNRNIFRSLDGGATWGMLQPPGDGLALGLQADLAERQPILPDRVLQATANGDLWEYGAFAPCAIQPTLGFGQAWTQHPEWQEFSGCPVSPEQPVQVHTSHDASKSDPAFPGVPLVNVDTYWTDAVCVCVTVEPAYNGRLHVWRAGKDCGDAGDRSLAGAVLPFTDGEYWLSVPTSGGQGLVINSQGGLTTVGP